MGVVCVVCGVGVVGAECAVGVVGVVCVVCDVSGVHLYRCLSHRQGIKRLTYPFNLS